MNKSKFQSSHSNKGKLFAKKSLGQNFLIDQNVIDRIISELNPQSSDTIIEIGAGRGALTKKLIESGANIVAIELDRDLIPLLQKEFGDNENFKLIEQDALDVDFGELVKNQSKNLNFPVKAKLIANLPYYISTAILQKIIDQREYFSELILMLQREVVERITATPGKKERGFLTVLVEAEFDAEKLFDVPPDAFNPIPKVWSSIIRLITKNDVTPTEKNKMLFREILSFGFQQKRKTIFNNFKNLPVELNAKFDKKGGVVKVLEALNIEPQRRAETLTVAEWKSICDLLAR